MVFNGGAASTVSATNTPDSLFCKLFVVGEKYQISILGSDVIGAICSWAIRFGQILG